MEYWGAIKKKSKELFFHRTWAVYYLNAEKSKKKLLTLLENLNSL